MVMTFDVNPANKMAAVGEALDSMQGYLSRLRMKPAEENRAMLMFEESLVSLMEHAGHEHPQRITAKADRLSLGEVGTGTTLAGDNYSLVSMVVLTEE